MASPIIMPKLGLTMEKGTVINWYKQEGDSVQKGEIIFEVETDKIVNSVESPASGTLLKILVEEGVEVDVLTVLAVIGEPDENISEFIQTTSKKSQVALKTDVTVAEKAQKVYSQSKSGPPARQIEQRLTPRARKLLADKGISPSILKELEKTRITETDVKDFLKKNVKESSKVEIEGFGELQPLSRVQKIIADKMTHSFRDIPQFSLRFQVVMNHILSLLPQLGKDMNINITINDLIIRASALALFHYPDVQNQYRAEGIFKPGDINIGLAVAMDDKLIVPVIRNANRKTIIEISKETDSLINRAKNNQLNPDELTGITFTVSNLGMYGITSFVPILNPGEGAVLGVGALQRVPHIVENTVSINQVIEFTLVCDHRSVNGNVGAIFCQEFKKIMESKEVNSW